MLLNVIENKVKITPELLEVSDVNACDIDYEYTVLSFAIWKEYSIDQIKLLLKYGASTTICVRSNIISSAISNSSIEVIKLILENTSKFYIREHNNEILSTVF